MEIPEQTTNQQVRGPTVSSIVDLTASIAMIAAASVLTWHTLRPPSAASKLPKLTVPSEPLTLDGAPVLGSQGARVGMIVFSDFECPFCAKFAVEILPSLKARYLDRGLVKLAFRHLPLPNHSRALAFATAAECAAQQQKFWPMHDLIFSIPKTLPDTEFNVRAASAGMEMATFARCRELPGEQIEKDLKMARTLRIGGTPAFFVGPLTGDRVTVQAALSGARPLQDFVRLLDGVLETNAGEQ